MYDLGLGFQGCRGSGVQGLGSNAWLGVRVSQVNERFKDKSC